MDRLLSLFVCLLYCLYVVQLLMFDADLYPNELFIVRIGEELFIYICIVATQWYVTVN